MRVGAFAVGVVAALLGGACTGRPAAGPAHPTTPAVSPSAAPTPTGTPAGTPTPPAEPGPVPSFSPLGASFVSAGHGWFLGTRPGCGPRCRVLLETRDRGRTFTELPAPPAPAAQVRFADDLDGWVFGPRSPSQGAGLWRTRDGGHTWRQVQRNAVTSLEVAAGSVWLVMQGPDGTSPALYRAPVADDRLRRVTAIPDRSGYVVVTGRTAYAVAVQGAGPIGPGLLEATAAGWGTRTVPACAGAANGFGDVVLAAAVPGQLLATCAGEPSAGSELKEAFASSDGGRTWTRRPDPPVGGYTGLAYGGSLATAGTTSLLTGFRSPVYREVGAGAWRAVLDDPGLGQGFSYVGLTDPSHAVALGPGGVWLSDDGGQTWRRLDLGSR